MKQAPEKTTGKQKKENTMKIFTFTLLLLFSLVATSMASSKPTVQINFEDTDIRVFIKYISQITGKNFVVDSNVLGTVSILSPKKLTVAESYKLFESVLNLNGFTTVQAGTVTKILPSIKARGENLQLENNNKPSYPSDNIITQLIKLKNTTPQEMKDALQPLISSTSVITIHDQSNILLITDTRSNIQKLLEIIKALDIDEIRFHVINLQHAKAKDIMEVLEKFNDTEQTIKIKSDEKTNTLIVKSSPSDFKDIKKVIDSLDLPRKMVYLEALILEVNTQEDFQLGVKWFIAGNKNSGTVGTSWGGGSGFTLDTNLTGTEDYSRSSGFNLGYLGQAITIAGVEFPDIAALLSAHKSNENYNIIATPQILTANNSEAQISVGSNIPYLTRSEESNSGNGYSNYEYKDVATTLSILPQINQSDTLLLQINTEVSKINASASTEGKPTTYKRTAKTTVIVKNNETIVIGGIIGDDSASSEWKVPLLGDIPLIGSLFKSNGTTHQKTNMFIFITPHIITNPSEIKSITAGKRLQISESNPDTEQHFPLDKLESASLANLAFSQMQKNENESAIYYFQKALRIDPYSPYILCNLSTIMELVGEKEKAKNYYKKLILLSNKKNLSKIDQEFVQNNILLWQQKMNNLSPI